MAGVCSLLTSGRKEKKERRMGGGWLVGWLGGGWLDSTEQHRQTANLLGAYRCLDGK